MKKQKERKELEKQLKEAIRKEQVFANQVNLYWNDYINAKSSYERWLIEKHAIRIKIIDLEKRK